jgi:hypothetical protein
MLSAYQQECYASPSLVSPSIDCKREKVARPGRFELPTSCFGGKRSIQLSYGRAEETAILPYQFSFSPPPLPVGIPWPSTQKAPHPFERFLISRANFSISSAFFIRFKLSTLLESVFPTSSFSSEASW